MHDKVIKRLCLYNTNKVNLVKEQNQIENITERNIIKKSL